MPERAKQSRDFCLIAISSIQARNAFLDRSDIHDGTIYIGNHRPMMSRGRQQRDLICRGMFHIGISSEHASLRGPLVMVGRGDISHSPLEYTTPEHASGNAEMINRALLPLAPSWMRRGVPNPGETRLALAIVTGLLN